MICGGAPPPGAPPEMKEQEPTPAVLAGPAEPGELAGETAQHCGSPQGAGKVTGEASHAASDE